MRNAAPTCTVIVCLLLAACGDPPPPLIQSRLYSMGTWVDLSIRDSTDPSAALAEVESMLAAFERDFYAWAPGELAALNDAIAAGEVASVSTELGALLAEAVELSARSGGMFEPGLAAVVELWGFQSPLTARDAPPPEAEIEARLRDARISALVLDGISASSRSRGLKIDLGGIAKGAAVDAVAGIFRAHGIEHALINAGGDLAVLGRSGGDTEDRPWRVGIKHPRDDGLLGTIALASGEAAFTSGDYERFFETDGRRYHHLLDPLSGRPVDHTQAVTVIADNGTLADAAATAIFVAGPAQWTATAAALGIEAVLRVDGDGNVEMTAAMRARLTPAGATDSAIITRAGQDEPD